RHRYQSLAYQVSAHLHHDEGEIVVLLRVADPGFHLGGNPRADLVGGQVSDLSEQLLQTILAELFGLRVVRLGNAGGEREEDVAGAQLDGRFFVGHVRKHADDGSSDGELLDLG